MPAFHRLLLPLMIVAVSLAFSLLGACTPPETSEPKPEPVTKDASTAREPSVTPEERPPELPEVAPEVTTPDDGGTPTHACQTPKQKSPLSSPPRLLRSWQGHGPTSFYVRSWSTIAKHEGEKLVAIAFEDSRFVRLVDIGTGKLVRTLSGGHREGIYGVAFSPDGKWVATGGFDDVVVLWETRTGKKIHTLKERGDVRLLAFSPDSKTLASTSTGDRVMLWDVAKGELKFDMPGHSSDTQSVAWHPSGDWVVSGSNDGTIRLWNATTGKAVFSFGSRLGYVQRLLFSSNGRQLLSGSNNDEVRLWNFDTKQKPTQVFSKRLNGDIVGLGFLPDGKRVLALTHRDRDTVSLLSRTDGQLQRNFHNLYYPTFGLLSKDGKSLWQIQRGFGKLIKTEISSEKELVSANVYDRREVGAAFFDGGKQLVTLGRRGSEIWLREPNAGTTTLRLSAPTGVQWTTLAAEPDGFKVFLSTEGGQIHVWDLRKKKELSRWNGHFAAVVKIVLSKDKKRLFTASIDGTVRIWDTATGKSLQTLSGHTRAVSDIALSDDETILVSGSFDKTVKVWDARSGQLKKTLEGHKTSVWSVAISPDKNLIASGERDKKILLWSWNLDVKPGELNKHSSIVSALLFGRDSKTLLSGSYDRTIRRWDVKSGELLPRIGTHRISAVRSLAWNKDFTAILSTGEAETLYRWQLSSLDVDKTLAEWKQEVKAFAVNRARTVAAVGDDKGSIRLISLPEGKEIRVLKDADEEILKLVFSPDGTLLLSSGSQQKNTLVWDVRSGKKLRALNGHKDKVYSMAFSPDGKHAITVSGDWSYKFWEVASGKELRSAKEHTAMVNAVAFSPDGKWFATGSYDRRIIVWDAATGKKAITFAGHQGGVNGLIFSLDSKLLFSSSFDTYVMEWRLSDKRRTRILTGHQQGLTAMEMSPSGRYLLTSSFDKRIGLWDLRRGSFLRFYFSAKAPAVGFYFGPNEESFVAATEDKKLQQWALRSPLSLFAGTNYSIQEMLFAPDGTTLLTASRDQYIRFWKNADRPDSNYIGSYPYRRIHAMSIVDQQKRLYVGHDNGQIWYYDLKDRSHKGVLRGHQSTVLAMRPTRDGQWLLTGSADNQIRIWDLNDLSTFDVLRGHTGPVTGVLLSADEEVLISSSADGTVRLWEMQTGTLQTTLRGYTAGITSLSPHPTDNKKFLTTALDGTLKIWTLDGKLEKNLCFSQPLQKFAHNKTSKRSALLLSDGTILVLDDKWQITQRLRPGTVAFQSLVWSPDGTTLAAGDVRGELSVWKWEK